MQNKIDDKFYGRRKGRPLRIASTAAMKKETYAFDIKDVSDDLRALFPVPVKEVHLEIGFGGGEHLVKAAKDNPDIGFIGAEAFINGYAQCAANAEEAGLQNVRLWGSDVRPLLDALHPQSLERIYLLYPDPWPKRRHWKRRFLNPHNIARLTRVLKTGGEFRFATDWADYAAYGLMYLRRAKELAWPAIKAEDWLQPYEGWIPTRFELRARNEGRASVYLRFIRA